MALVNPNRVKETTETTGTGTYTLEGATGNFQGFTAVGDGNTCYYCCTDGTQFEIGIGTFTASGTTLARTTILSSTNSNNAINWSSGEKDIFVTLPSSKLVFEDASNNVAIGNNITVGGTVDGRDLATDGAKLDGIEASATADQTAAEIRTLVESATDSNVFTDADHTKLNGIEASATADQTAAEIRTLVESATDSNVFTDADHTKLNGIEASATADQTDAEIKTAYENNSDTNAFTDALLTKLNGIETSATADQTKSDIDALNINADLLDGQHGSYYQTAATALGYVDVATANYGTIKVDDDRGVSWAGYGIRDDWTMMSDGASNFGIYNDTDNEWAILCRRNAEVELYHNGSEKAYTQSGGFYVNGTMTASGNVTAYSDEKLKDNIEPIENPIEKIKAIQGVTFNRNDIEGNPKQTGVIAQQVERVLPEVVETDEKGIKTVAYGNMVGLLVEAIRKQQDEIEELRAILEG
ncbi:MAG: hypothetical protein CMB98_02120 [Flavobacteriaceae bacterium]|nr:hypothetical protein [Flavobacteriaceae bacterium]|tara:strand:+ start:637 stop:2052 length:1416 start_codon:yes stop_codon:yes gene_type:complete